MPDNSEGVNADPTDSTIPTQTSTTANTKVVVTAVVGSNFGQSQSHTVYSTFYIFYTYTP